MKFIILTGLYRSGKTFTLQVMNQHNEITMIGHSILSYFKVLESEYFKNRKYNFLDRPFNLNYLGDDKDYQGIINDTVFNAESIKELLEKIEQDIVIDISLAGVKSTLDCDFINSLRKKLVPGKAVTVFEQICFTIAEYGNAGDKTFVGFAELNLEQFILPLILAFGDKIKIVHIKRDPRAILASRNYSDKYIESEGRNKIHPLLLIAKMWRNSIRYKWGLTSHQGENYFSLSYENLMSQPEDEIKRMCRFLNLDFEKNMLDVSRFTDYDGKKWESYSSFKKVKGFSIETIDRWKNVIPREDLAAFEYLCSYEMIREGYIPLTSAEEHFSAFTGFNEDRERLSSWVFEYDLALSTEQKEKEIFRSFSLNNQVTRSKSLVGGHY
jgi:hypothetical protein